MKSIEFITEAQVKPYQSSNLQIDRAVALLNQHCKESLAMIRNPLWRGMDNHTTEIIMIDPTTGKRQSENTSNYYTQIMSHSPYFEGWPKRNRSLICSSGKSYAENYGTSYAIFPFDGVKIAVCPGEDMWATEVVIPELDRRFCDSRAMNNFNIYLMALGFPEQWTDMVKYAQSDKLQKKIKKSIPPDKVMPALFTALSPQQCGFKLMPISQFAENPPKNKECWVGGPVIAIRQDMYRKFLSAVVKQEKL